MTAHDASKMTVAAVDVVLHFEQICVCSLKHFTILCADLRDVIYVLFHLMSMIAENAEPQALLENERGHAKRTTLSIRWNGFVCSIERPSEFESPKLPVVIFLKRTIVKPQTWRVTCGCPHRAISCRPPDAPYRLNSLTMKRHSDVVHDLAHRSGESNSFHTQTTSFWVARASNSATAVALVPEVCGASRIAALAVRGGHDESNRLCAGINR